MLEAFTWYRQSAYRYEGDGLTVYIDPWGVPDDAPPGDVIFLTHAHADHFAPDDFEKVRSEKSTIVAPRDVANDCGLTGTIVPVAPGDTIDAGGIKAEAVPAYNIAEDRLDKHPKENNWVGYILSLGDASYYFAGDTDHVPELGSLKAQVAFVPIGGTYTMDADEAAGLIREIRPTLAVPCHYGFIVGTPADAERFKASCDPIEVELMEPQNPFEKTS
jgi:L-ascorbate metabolism protein UlaG (beta-lactamase superfamily)